MPSSHNLSLVATGSFLDWHARPHLIDSSMMFHRYCLEALRWTTPAQLGHLIRFLTDISADALDVVYHAILSIIGRETSAVNNQNFSQGKCTFVSVLKQAVSSTLDGYQRNFYTGRYHMVNMNERPMIIIYDPSNLLPASSQRFFIRIYQILKQTKLSAGKFAPPIILKKSISYAPSLYWTIAWDVIRVSFCSCKTSERLENIVINRYMPPLGWLSQTCFGYQRGLYMYVCVDGSFLREHVINIKIHSQHHRKRQPQILYFIPSDPSHNPISTGSSY